MGTMLVPETSIVNQLTRLTTREDLVNGEWFWFWDFKHPYYLFNAYSYVLKHEGDPATTYAPYHKGLEIKWVKNPEMLQWSAYNTH
jgi:hypothetical protein